MAGTRTICKGIRAKCPHCDNSLDLSDMGTELFRRMLEELVETGRVEAEGLGIFKIAELPARSVANFGREAVAIPAMKVIRFKASTHAKEKLNGRKKIHEKETDNRERND